MRSLAPLIIILALIVYSLLAANDMIPESCQDGYGSIGPFIIITMIILPLIRRIGRSRSGRSGDGHQSYPTYNENESVHNRSAGPPGNAGSQSIWDSYQTDTGALSWGKDTNGNMGLPAQNDQKPRHSPYDPPEAASHAGQNPLSVPDRKEEAKQLRDLLDSGMIDMAEYRDRMSTL